MAALLEVEGLHAHYDKSHILHGVSIDRSRRARSSACSGATARAARPRSRPSWGWCRRPAGRCASTAAILPASAPIRVARAGIAYVPEEREIFANITVDENLRIGMQPARPGVPAWTVDQMFAFFPQLKERRTTAAGMLSGGEQQMLTICRVAARQSARHPDRRADRGAGAQDRRGRDRGDPRHLPARAFRCFSSSRS